MRLHIKVPEDLETELLSEGVDLEAVATEATAISLYREGKLNLYQLGRWLGLDRHETKALLQRKRVYEGSLTLEDLEQDQRAIDLYFAKRRSTIDES